MCPWFLLLALPQGSSPIADDRLRSVRHLQLGEDVGNVMPHGLRAQGELPCDRRVGVPLGDELKDLAFAVGEGREGLNRSASLR